MNRNGPPCSGVTKLVSISPSTNFAYTNNCVQVFNILYNWLRTKHMNYSEKVQEHKMMNKM